MKTKYLGKPNNPKTDSYSPNFLDSVERHSIDMGSVYGLDSWNAYEFSYLNAKNQPVFESLEIKVPMNSLVTVESKSLKIYLASFYNKKFNNSAKACKLIEKDLGKLLQSKVSVTKKVKYENSPKAVLLNRAINKIKKNTIIKFEGFRSICPVTSQPDWATIYLHSSSSAIEPKPVIKLLKSFRQRGDFHEACIESIFCTLARNFLIKDLTVFGRFLRRGGIDINPIRSSSKKLLFKNFRDHNQ